MKIIGSALSFIWRVWFVLICVIFSLFFSIFIITPLLLFNIDFKIIASCLRIWAMLIFYGSGFCYKLHSSTKFDKNQTYIIVCNHTSLMDIMLMLVVVKQPMVFVGKKELSKLPFFGHVYKQINVCVDRANAASRTSVYRRVAHKIKEGKSVCIFAEGGVPDPSVFLDKFEDGPFALSVLLKVPMAVFTFCGMKQHMPYGYFSGGPGKIDVYLNKIIPAGAYSKQQIQAYKSDVRSSIYNQLKACENK